jgi:type I restriction enzyme S subunit
MRIPVNAEERELRIGNIPYYGANGLQGFIDSHIFDEPLILMAEDGGYFDEFATRPIAYRIYGKSWVNNHAHVLRAKKGFCQDAIFYALEHKDIQPFIVGGTRAKLNQGELRAITIVLPEATQEQTKIATILSTLDRAIEQTEEIIAKQQRIKAGLMQDLLTKGIDEHGVIRSEATHQFKDSPLGRIPVEWEVESLKNMTSKIVDGVHHTPTYVSEGVPFITITDITAGEGISFENVRYVSPTDHTFFVKRADPRTGDVLVTKDGTLGVARIVSADYPEFSIFVSVAQIRPKDKICTPELIWSFFESGEFKIQLGALSAGTGLTHIHLEHFREFRLRLPPYKEQLRIFEIVTDQGSVLRANIASLNKLRAQKRGLMHDLLTGTVRVPMP